MPLNVVMSNRMEVLAGALAQHLLVSPLSLPLSPEILLVQNRGMEHWLSMEIASHQGVCANIRFLFPEAFFEEILGKALPGLSRDPRFAPEVLTWRILGLLPVLLEDQGFEDLKSYLHGPDAERKAFQLAARIARLFDQYLLFRPAMVLGWERGEDTHWQATLWRACIEGSEGVHGTAVAARFLEAAGKDRLWVQGLPERVSVFGFTALPRLHLQVLEGLSRHREVTLYQINPCEEYWGDILPEVRIEGLLSRGRGRTREGMHLVEGNALLASLGRQGKEFLDLLLEYPSEGRAFFEDPGEGSLLTAIQSDILHLRDRSLCPLELSPNDRSMEIHACHSPLREMEVLYDLLLSCFEEDPSLGPADVLVMTPDIERYAPLVRAVFDTPEEERVRIPFAIADRNPLREGPLSQTLMAVFELSRGRFTASEVFRILESPLVFPAFGLGEQDLDRLRSWVRDVRIHWGLDEEDRGRLGLPPSPDNTWEAGLNRLFLGYAMPGDNEGTWGGILPYDLIEGGEALALGGLARLLERLRRSCALLSERHTPREWAGILREILGDLFSPREEDAGEHEILRKALAFLEALEAPETAGFSEPVGREAIQGFLAQVLESRVSGKGYLTGGVTFCAMLPMRSIPARVVCLCGMDHDAFPRQARRAGFDLMAQDPMPGDRDRRSDDRYLFLETLLSARERLIVTYVGRSIEDDSPIPPSVLVSELMDVIEEGFRREGKSPLEESLRRHRLQPFSPAYFEARSPLFSYGGLSLRAARRFQEPRNDPAVFVPEPLPPPDPEMRVVSVDDLCRFYSNPCRYLLERRLKIRLREEDALLEDREVMTLDPLTRYGIQSRMLGLLLEGKGREETFSLLRASGGLPHGAVGEAVYDALADEVALFSNAMGTWLRGPALEPLGVDLSLGGFRLTGEVRPVHPNAFVSFRAASPNGKDRVRLLIRHLASITMAREGYPRTSLHAGLKNTEKSGRIWVGVCLEGMENASQILEDLLSLYWEGLSQPLHFFPECSWAYMNTCLNPPFPPKDPLEEAKKAWVGQGPRPGEGEDPYIRTCFPMDPPLDEAFEAQALRVFGFLATVELEPL